MTKVVATHLNGSRRLMRLVCDLGNEGSAKFVQMIIQTLSYSDILMGLDAKKPVFRVCEQQRRRPACASAQSDQRLCYSVFGKYHM